MEREYKMRVLEWLNNGKPKLFRSPTEGNFLVRLMNVSLTPNDTLGRMLHTFSATAYEIDSADPETLIKAEYNILKEQKIDGIVDFYSQRNTISYPLSMLSRGLDMIKDNRELNNRIVIGAAFYRNYNPTHTLNVKINGSDVNVYNNTTYEGEISSILAGSSGFQPGHNDLAILTYRNVLNENVINQYISYANDFINYGSWWGFNLLELFSCLKKFFQFIYKIICKIRDVIKIIIDWTIAEIKRLIEAFRKGLNFVHNNITKPAIDWIKELIKKNYRGGYIENFIYEFSTPDGTTCCFFDAFTKKILTDAKNNLLTLRQTPCLTFVRDAAKSTYNYIKEKTTFYTSQIPSDIKNIIANPFTSVEMIYKTQENTIRTTFNNISTTMSNLKLTDTYVGTSFLQGLSDKVMQTTKGTISLPVGIASKCETIMTRFKEALSEGKILTIDKSTVADQLFSDSTVSSIVEKTAETVQNIANAAIGDLGLLLNSQSELSEIINTGRTFIINSINSLKGLFGGVG